MLNLGQTVPLNLPFDKQYYLEVNVGNGTPYQRTLLTANPYSMNSLYATKSDTATIALTVVDGAITQTKLDPSVQALPWGCRRRIGRLIPESVTQYRFGCSSRGDRIY